MRKAVRRLIRIERMLVRSCFNRRRRQRLYRLQMRYALAWRGTYYAEKGRLSH